MLEKLQNKWPCFLITATIACLLLHFSLNAHANMTWGEKYFPNTSLVNQDGKSFRFFDDLLKNKIVVVNFIYTSCPDTCPLETAQLTRVQGILGDRLGKDIFFYSISIDPDNDTPAVLKEYRKKFDARWMFLTGDKNEIIELRRKLGLYIENNTGGETNHNVSMIIGNQKTGRWMKRSPFENPYVLADQLGNWLDDWKSPQVSNYENAPSLRHISDGEQLFRTRCESCHAIGTTTADTATGAARRIGPNLFNVTQRRSHAWLVRWLKEPDKMLEEKDPIAYAMYKQYNEIPMPNMNLSRVDINDVLSFLRSESQRLSSVPRKSESTTAINNRGVITIINAWLRESLPGIANAGYMTLVNTSDQDIKIVGIDSAHFKSAEMHEMITANGMMDMQQLAYVVIPARGKIHFKPGKKHFMFQQPLKHLQAGDNAEMTLQFESGQKQTIWMDVKRPTSDQS